MLPALEVGVFALSNASLGASFSLPFDGTPVAVKFAFSHREHPFSLTVSLLGGGGFFGIGISSHGVNEIEAALEFGACCAIDLGVASGSVEVKAGIYFHWLEPSPDKGVGRTRRLRPHSRRAVRAGADLGRADLQPAARLSQGSVAIRSSMARRS